MNYIIILIFLISVAVFVSFSNYKSNESFNDDGSEFMPLGYHRYGLRGEKIRTRPINDCYWDQYKCYTSTANPKFPPYDMTQRVATNKSSLTQRV
jgi:hypothetical protein